LELYLAAVLVCCRAVAQFVLQEALNSGIPWSYRENRVALFLYQRDLNGNDIFISKMLMV
jgi:hypothetical protein